MFPAGRGRARSPPVSAALPLLTTARAEHCRPLSSAAPMTSCHLNVFFFLGTLIRPHSPPKKQLRLGGPDLRLRQCHRTRFYWLPRPVNVGESSSRARRARSRALRPSAEPRGQEPAVHPRGKLPTQGQAQPSCGAPAALLQGLLRKLPRSSQNWVFRKKKKNKLILLHFLKWAEMKGRVLLWTTRTGTHRPRPTAREGAGQQAEAEQEPKASALRIFLPSPRMSGKYWNF